MKVDPVPEGLDGGNDAGRKRAPGHNLEINAPPIVSEREWLLDSIQGNVLFVKVCSKYL